MDIIEKMLRKDNRLTTLNNKKDKKTVKQIVRSFSGYRIPIVIKDDLSFFDALIMAESLKNKLALENEYDKSRTGLYDVWDILSYQERNGFINKDLDLIKKEMHGFTDDENHTIWITFFDELLNSLYNKEMVIFELQQYYRLYRDFSQRLTKTHHYGLLPYRNSFLDITLLAQNETTVVFYYQNTRCLYRLNSDFSLRKIPLSKVLCSLHPINDQLILLANPLLECDGALLIDQLNISELISVKAKKRLTKAKPRILGVHKETTK